MPLISRPLRGLPRDLSASGGVSPEAGDDVPDAEDVVSLVPPELDQPVGLHPGARQLGRGEPLGVSGEVLDLLAEVLESLVLLGAAEQKVGRRVRTDVDRVNRTPA